ncbi:glycoside hydrolase family 127 protein [Alkalibacterium iburiense]|uniref:Glycoside hydrolase family 127 protein n=1 Tax=Alkalibacterium iburiense TaxID=290589 RepID=A0ABP3GWQ7_9LACT
MAITITDSFWQRYTDLIRNEMIPYQWDVLHDNLDIFIDKERDDPGIPSEKSHAIDNLKIAAGQKEGSHYGWLFQDSDVYKWLESAANSYALKQDDKLLDMMDEVVALIEDAQEDDGYLSTYYQIEAPELRFRRLFESHELYCAGHLIEAAVAHYKATGSERLIKVSEKFVECIKNHFGPEEGKINGADGHQEIEWALIKLYEVTGKEEYVDLSKWFLEIRGQDPDFYSKQLLENKEKGIDDRSIPHINLKYHQAHQPIHEQEEAVGHAVRLVYMAAAMAEVAAIHKDDKMFQSAKRLWDNIIKKRFYITGGIGSTVHGEAFTFDYDLPNDSMYCETCASIGLLFFARAMLKNEVDVEYAEVMERTLYNTIISGMALDGKHFFYTNPLEVNPEASQKDPGKSHVKPTRPSWFGCACCPPNLARTLTSLNKYVTSVDEEAIYVHLLMDFEGEIESNNQTVSLTQTVDLSDRGKVELSVKGVTEPVKIYIRLPEWGDMFYFENNSSVKDGYAEFIINEDKTLSIEFEMPVLMWQAHPLVRQNKGKVALQRGPYVYCLVEEDNGPHLHLLTLTEKPVAEEMSDSVLGDFFALKGKAKKIKSDDSWKNVLYQQAEKEPFEEVSLTFIPYHLWANRSVGEMMVWIDKGEE